MNTELTQALGQMTLSDPDPRDQMFRTTDSTASGVSDPVSGSAVKEEVDQNHASKVSDSEEQAEKQRKVDALSPKGF